MLLNVGANKSIKCATLLTVWHCQSVMNMFSRWSHSRCWCTSADGTLQQKPAFFTAAFSQLPSSCCPDGGCRTIWESYTPIAITAKHKMNNAHKMSHGTLIQWQIQSIYVRAESAMTALYACPLANSKGMRQSCLEWPYPPYQSSPDTFVILKD